MYTRAQLDVPERLELEDLVRKVNKLLEASPELRGSAAIKDRTVRYYMREKLLPPREDGRRGPGTTYPASFVYRLLFIKLLKKRGLSLGDIGDYLASAMGQISDETIKSILLGEEPLEIGYAHDYDQAVLEKRRVSGEELIFLRPGLQLNAPDDFQEGCVFCGPDDAQIIRRGQFSVAIRDKSPVSPGHTLIIPIRHVHTVFEISELELADMFDLLKRVRMDLEVEFHPDGFNIGINEGRAAGQSIMHLHLHVIPRYAGDKPDPRGGIRWVFPEKAEYWES